MTEIHPSKWTLLVCPPLWLEIQCHVGINGAGCPPAGCAMCQRDTSSDCLEIQRKTSSEKLTTTLTGQKVYKCLYPIDKSSRWTWGNWSLLKQLVQFSTNTVWILQVCLVQLISITAQVTVVNTWGGLNGKGAGSEGSHLLCGVSGATPRCTKTYNEKKPTKNTSNSADASVVTMWLSPPRQTWHKCDCFSELRLLLSTFACSYRLDMMLGVFFFFLVKRISIMCRVCMHVRELEPEGLWI